MIYLLDTHTLLWSLTDTKKLSNYVKTALKNSESVHNISTVSFWEISIKYSLGKLDLRRLTPESVFTSSLKAGYKILEITPNEASSFYKLPRANKDPFDRMIAWQAINNNMELLSKDIAFDEYKKFGLRREW